MIKSFEESSETLLFLNNKNVVSYVKKFVATYEKKKWSFEQKSRDLKKEFRG